jgi:hypothetical protein
LTVAHGGIAGAVVELLVVLTVAAIFIAVWLRERQAGRKRPSDGPARLRDDE